MAAKTSWRRYGTKLRHCHRTLIRALGQVYAKRHTRVREQSQLQQLQKSRQNKAMRLRLRSGAAPWWASLTNRRARGANAAVVQFTRMLLQSLIIQ